MLLIDIGELGDVTLAMKMRKSCDIVNITQKTVIFLLK